MQNAIATLENSWAILYKLKHIQQFLVHTKSLMYTSHLSIHNHQNLETSKFPSTDVCINKPGTYTQWTTTQQ